MTKASFLISADILKFNTKDMTFHSIHLLTSETTNSTDVSIIVSKQLQSLFLHQMAGQVSSMGLDHKLEDISNQDQLLQRSLQPSTIVQ